MKTWIVVAISLFTIAGTVAAAPPPDAAFKDDPAFREAILTGVKELDLSVRDKAWDLPPDPAPTSNVKATSRPVALKGGEKKAAETGRRAIVTSRNGTLAYAAYGGGRGGAATSIEVVDLVKGTSVGVFDVTPGATLLDVSPDGAAFLLRSEGRGFGKRDRLEVWTLQGASAKRTVIFFPYSDAGQSGRDVDSAKFVDATHLLTVSFKGKLVLWELPTCKAVYSCMIGSRTTPALSPGGKHLAIDTGTSSVIIDSLSGKALGKLSPAVPWRAFYCFSPTGKQLAASDGQSVQVWDVATGKLHRTFYLATPYRGGSFALTSDGYGLLAGMYLIDFERRITLWRYEGTRLADTVSASGHYMYLAQAGKADCLELLSCQLPHPEASALAMKLKPEDLLLKPGMKVSLEVNVDASEAEKKQIMESLKKRLTDNGFVIEGGQPLKFVASTEAGKTTEWEYYFLNSPSKKQKVSVAPRISKLALLADGKVAWQTQTSIEPGTSLSVREGQTLEQAVAESSKPNLSFLKETELPVYLAKPHDPAWYGSSVLGGK